MIITIYPSCHILSNKTDPSIDQTIINMTKIIHANAFTIVSANQVFLISIATITFFTTFQSQYKNQIALIITQKTIQFQNQIK